MNRRTIAVALTVAGAAGVLFYVLASPRGASPALVKAGGVTLYAGIAALLAAAVLRFAGRRGPGRHDR